MKKISSSKWFLWVAFHYIIFKLLLWFRSLFKKKKHSILPSDVRSFFVLQFQFVNSYLSLFYIGFYLKDMERLKEVRNISISALMFFPSRISFSNSFGLQHLSLLQSLILTSFALSAYMHWFYNHPSVHPSICTSAEDAAGVVSVKESPAAGPGQSAAFPLLQDPDACGLCSLVLQSLTQVQSMIPLHPLSGQEVKGPFLTTSVFTLHALCRSRHELELLMPSV